MFPIYDSLKIKTTESFQKSQIIGLLLTTAIYLSFSTISIMLFRGNIEPSVLGNFSSIYNAKGNPYIEA